MGRNESLNPRHEQRRRIALGSGRADPQQLIAAEYDDIRRRFMETRQFLVDNKMFTPYSASPRAFGDWMKAVKDHGLFTRKALDLSVSQQKSIVDPDVVYDMGKQDFFTKVVRGLSLADIDEMRLPLGREDIQRISKWFRFSFFKRNETDQKALADTLVLLATIPHVGKERLPDQVTHLKEVSQAFFDYFVSFIAEGAENPQDEAQILYAFAFKKYLASALGVYLPAKLGISPASARKLIEVNGEFSELGKVSWARASRFLYKSLPTSFPPSVPEDLKPYLQYDKRADEEAEKAILAYASSHDIQGESQHKQRVKDVNAFLAHNRPYLSREITRHNGSFTYSPSDVFESITALAPYAHSTIFIAKLKNSSHLTIELDQDGYVYGIPASLYKKMPHIEDLLLTALLSIPFPKAAKPEPTLHAAPIPFNVPSFMLPEGAFGTEKEEKAPKRKASHRIPFSREDVSEIPQSPQEPRQKCFVDYTEESIRTMLGARLDPNMHEKVAGMLFRFEQGWKKPKPLHANGRELWSLRSGDTRIIIEHVGNSRYSLVTIGDRGEVYEDLVI